MKVLIVLCIIGFTYAKHFGYTYEPPSYSNTGITYGSSSNLASSYSQPSKSYLSPVISGSSISVSPFSYKRPYQTSTSYSTNSYSSPSYSSSSGPSYSSSAYSVPNYSTPSFSAATYSTPASLGSPYTAPVSSAPSYSAPASSAPSYSSPASSSPSYSLSTNTAPSYSGPSYTTSNGEVQKEFYTFTAPESEFEDTNSLQNALNSVKRGIRVVFIKNPENKGYEDAALALAKQAAEQQTTIFVLNKQHDVEDLANKLNAVNKNVKTKPDVHFVKYRTPEDAANAQKAIQSEYDSLDGPSANINGGVAPVLNFASRAPIAIAGVKQPDNTYLPSSIFRSTK